MTLADLMHELFEAGCPRARVVEFQGKGEVRLQVPVRFIGAVARRLEPLRPVGIVIKYAPLPWWRCRFTQYVVRSVPFHDWSC